MSKRKAQQTASDESKNQKSFTDLFTMTDARSAESGTYYKLNTTVESRKDVKMTKTNMRTPQFDVEYNGKIKTITIGIHNNDRADWPYTLAKFIGLQLNPPTEVYLEGWYPVNVNGDLTKAALKSIREKAKRKFIAKTSLTNESDSETE